MKNIIKIFKRDLKNIFTNWVAVVVVIAIMIIPSLYSLINIEASWDPYSNTGNIPIAIINQDKGTVFKENDINLGNELVDKLKENNKMKWIFVDKETGKNGLINEKYYATIEIPEDFSENVSTLVSKNIENPKLIYTVNEKINAIAPKMTDAAVKTLKKQIDDNIVKTVSGILFRIADEIGIDLQKNRSEFREIINSVYDLDENMPKLEKLIDSAINGTISTSELTKRVSEIIPVASQTIDATDEFLKNSQEFSCRTQDHLANVSPIIKDDLVISEKLLDNTTLQLQNINDNVIPDATKKALLISSDTAKATKTSIEDARTQLKNTRKILDKLSDIEIPKLKKEKNSKEQTTEIKDQIDKQIKSLQSIQESLNDISKKISKSIDRLDDINDKLDILINKIDEKIKKLDNGEKLDTNAIEDITKVLGDIHTVVSDISDSYDSEIVPAFEEGIDSAKSISDASLVILEQGRDALPKIEEVLSNLTGITNLSNEELSKLKDKFPEIKNDVHEIADKFRELDQENKFDEIFDMVTNNWDEQSGFLANPIEVEDNRLFPWPNYGSIVTPFYTVLCLWIGGYMLSILLQTDADPFEDDREIKPYEVYFGKMLLFLFIGIGQSIIASTGALFILKSYSIHPIMFIFYTIFVSIVFTIIIYTAVSVFGKGGIVFGIVLLVIQVAGTSGNFPIEVNPEIFQKIYSFLPFTYAISGMRQIMAGIVYSILVRDISILTIFMVISLAIGILLKKIINRRHAKFIEKLEESLIMNG